MYTFSCTGSIVQCICALYKNNWFDQYFLSLASNDGKNRDRANYCSCISALITVKYHPSGVYTLCKKKGIDEPTSNSSKN